VTALRIATSFADAGEVVVVVDGELDYDTQGTLEDALRAALTDPPHRLVVDLAGVRYCDSSGLRVLVGAYHEAGAAGAGFVLRGARGQTERALRLTGIDQFVDQERAPGPQAETESRNAKNADDQRGAASTWGP
jgi:anti-anti-sigma factor